MEIIIGNKFKLGGTFGEVFFGTDITTDEEIIIGNKFKLGKKIASGTFGEVFFGTDITTDEEVAIKLESANAATGDQLLNESRVYKLLHAGSGGSGVPSVRHFGVEKGYNILVMDLLGPSLQDMFNYCRRKLSLKTVLMLANQMIARIQLVHSKSLVYRDIKPHNFVMGRGKNSNKLYLIDFGTAKFYMDMKTNQHVAYEENKGFVGTPEYVSMNAHNGIKQSRRDDMEALGYVFVYLLNGTLPWIGPYEPQRLKMISMISKKKGSISPEELCKGLPKEFAWYIEYCRSLQFDEKPDYGLVRRTLRDCFVRHGFEYDYEYDWTILKAKKTNESH